MAYSQLTPSVEGDELIIMFRLRSAEDWEPYIDETRHLYLDENLTVPRLVGHFRRQHQLDIRYVTPVSVLFSLFILTHSSPAKISSRSSSNDSVGLGSKMSHSQEPSGPYLVPSSANENERTRIPTSTSTIDS